jgi:hypothetical protein
MTALAPPNRLDKIRQKLVHPLATTLHLHVGHAQT